MNSEKKNIISNVLLNKIFSQLFQSDTSIDSEDSCVSVIFVPHPENRLVQVFPFQATLRCLYLCLYLILCLCVEQKKEIFKLSELFSIRGCPCMTSRNFG